MQGPYVGIDRGRESRRRETVEACTQSVVVILDRNGHRPPSRRPAGCPIS